MNQPKSRVYLIGVHYPHRASNSPSGFRILGTPNNKILEFVPYNKVYEIVSEDKDAVIGLTIEDGSLVGSNGALSNYDRFVNGKLVGRSKLVILSKIEDQGYKVFTPNDKVMRLTTKDTLIISQGYGIANGKAINTVSGGEIVPISGSYEVDYISDIAENNKSTANKKVSQNNTTQSKENSQPKVDAKPQNTVDKSQTKQKTIIKTPNTVQQPTQAAKIKKKKSFNSVRPNAVDGGNQKVYNGIRPKITGTPVSRQNSKIKSTKIDNTGKIIIDKDDTNKTAMSVEQMLAISMLQMRDTKPFFFAALKVIPRIESTEIPTMAVSLDKMYYNTDFVAQLSIPELNFVNLHEISHIMMKHHNRGKGKDPQIWNVACDYYINKVICDEFHVAPGSGPKQVMQGSNVRIEFPKVGGLYSSKIDINEDTPEKIYDEIMKDYTNKKQQSQNGQNQGQSGQGQGQSGQGQGQSSQGQPGQGQSGQSQGQSGQGSSGMGQSGQGQSSQEQGSSGQGQSQGGSGQPQGQGQGQGSGTGVINANFRGQNVSIQDGQQGNGINGDMVDDADSKNNSDSTNEQKSNSILQKVNVIYKQILESGNQCGRGKGNGGVVEAFVEKELIPKVNWRALVQNRLISKYTDEKSLSSPDRRFIQSGTYIEGPVKEEEKLEGLKLCIDTSGSMSDRDIAIAIGQIMQLCKMYDTQADLVYWDDGIQGIVPFEKLEEVNLKKYQAMGRGGTNPNCIFEEYSKPEYRYGMKVAPSMIIIFTDGYFPMPDIKYKSKFGRDTVWVLCSESSMPIEDFKPPFGRVAQFINKH